MGEGACLIGVGRQSMPLLANVPTFPLAPVASVALGKLHKTR